ncbi:MAG: tyrosine-type recombinase/integrase [Bacteroidota bacterium]|nr:tyrosine-type recombinase/integrase [Bacteroidota bacterium]
MQSHYPVQPFLDYLKFEKRFSKHTIVAYQTDLSNFFDYLHSQYGEMALRDISHIYIRSWLAGLKDDSMTAKTINRKISTLRSFFKYHVKRGDIVQTPMGKITAPKNEKRLPQFVAEKDIATLFSYVEFEGDWSGKTNRLLLLLLYNTGIRLSEVINLKESMINDSAKTIKILGKGNKERLIPVHNDVMNEIQKYRKEKHNQGLDQNEFLLVDEKNAQLKPRKVYSIAKHYLSLVTTIDKRSPHIFRHSFATHLMNNGADLNAVKELLGHSSLAATQVYTHNTIDKLKNIHKNAHPKA